MIASEEIYRHVLGRCLVALRPGTQEAMAKASDIPQSTLSRYELAQTDIDVVALRRLVAAAAPGLTIHAFCARVERVYEVALKIHGQVPGDGDVVALAQLAMRMAPRWSPRRRR